MNHPEGIEPPFTDQRLPPVEHHLAYGDDFFYEDNEIQSSLRPIQRARQVQDHFVRAYPRYLRHADHRDKLLEQLWPVSIPGETDTAIHQQHPSPQAATGLWQGRERARLAVSWRIMPVR